MRLPGDAETDMCVAWARSKEARRIAMTTWAPSGQHRDAREGDDALLTSDPADQQFTPRHSDRSSVETRRNYEGEAPATIARLRAARSQQAGGARSQRGVSPRRESPMSSPSWDSKSCISPAPMNGKSSSAHHRHGHSPSRRQSGHQIPSLGEIGKREERHDE